MGGLGEESSILRVSRYLLNFTIDLYSSARTQGNRRMSINYRCIITPIKELRSFFVTPASALAAGTDSIGRGISQSAGTLQRIDDQKLVFEEVKLKLEALDQTMPLGVLIVKLASNLS